MNITLQCVTCPFNSASMLSIKRKVTYRMWFHHSDRAALRHVAADTEYWRRLRGTQGEAVETGVSRQSCCVLLCVRGLTESLYELLNFNTGWSFLGSWSTPALFRLRPSQPASPCSPFCAPGCCRCHLKDPGAGAGAPNCATCHSQSRSGSLRERYEIRKNTLAKASHIFEGSLIFWEIFDFLRIRWEDRYQPQIRPPNMKPQLGDS